MSFRGHKSSISETIDPIPMNYGAQPTNKLPNLPAVKGKNLSGRVAIRKLPPK